MANSVHSSTHATTGTTSGGWSTQRIAICALFVAVSMIASYIEIPVPPVAWLKYDPSGAVCLIAGLAFGPLTGALVSVLSWMPHVLMDPWGGLMGILCTLALVLPASAIYAKKHTRSGAIAGMVIAGVTVLVVACVANIIVTPLYTPSMTAADVIPLLVPALIPFNVVKVVLNCAVTAIAYKPVSKLIAR